MLFSRLRAVNALPTYDIFNLQWAYWDITPSLSGGRPATMAEWGGFSAPVTTLFMTITLDVLFEHSMSFYRQLLCSIL